MDANERELLLKNEVFQIVGAAMEVSNELGCGFLEAVYQEALGIELDERKIPHVQQKLIEIPYKDRILKKEYNADFLCYDRIIVEIKAIKAITGIEKAQILNYLKATNLPLGLIINFGTPQLEWKRYVNTRRKPLMNTKVRELRTKTKNLLASIRVHSRLISALLICALLTTGCATLTTATHFTPESPMVYSGTRLDLHASANHDEVLRVYKDKYGVEPPACPKLDLPFSLLLDTLILFPVVYPIALYQAVFD